MILKNRTDAGKQLAKKLILYKKQDAIIFALPRGGVIVGYEIAKILHIPLTLFVARKIGAPNDPEFAIGAISEEGTAIFNEQRILDIGITKEFLEESVQNEI